MLKSLRDKWTDRKSRGLYIWERTGLISLGNFHYRLFFPPLFLNLGNSRWWRGNKKKAKKNSSRSYTWIICIHHLPSFNLQRATTYPKLIKVHLWMHLIGIIISPFMMKNPLGLFWYFCFVRYWNAYKEFFF